MIDARCVDGEGEVRQCAHQPPPALSSATGCVNHERKVDVRHARQEVPSGRAAARVRGCVSLAPGQEDDQKPGEASVGDLPNPPERRSGASQHTPAQRLDRTAHTRFVPVQLSWKNSSRSGSSSSLSSKKAA